MTLKEWEQELLRHLSELPKEEKEKIIEYYREIYGDKADAGYTNDSILEEFGFPLDCAKKILAETQSEKPAPEKEKPVKIKKEQRFTSASIVGLVFFTLLVFIPLASAAIGVIATFGAIAISGVAASVAGVAYSIVAPIYTLANGISLGGALFHFGLGIADVGVGILLSIGFYFLTKYMVIGFIKTFKYVYLRR